MYCSSTLHPMSLHFAVKIQLDLSEIGLFFILLSYITSSLFSVLKLNYPLRFELMKYYFLLNKYINKIIIFLKIRHYHLRIELR